MELFCARLPMSGSEDFPRMSVTCSNITEPRR